MRVATSREDAVDTVRQQTDLVELVGHYVSLKKSGRNYIGLCPFHGEKTPSFTVSPHKGFFHCFGCKASGDAYSFLMKIEGKTFPEALQDLAARVGVELPQRSYKDKRETELSQRLLEINDIAASFFQKQYQLANEKVRAYVKRRGLPDDVFSRFGLGYAPDGWQNLTSHLQQKKASLDQARSLGLIGQGNRGAYDILRDRLVFPIIGLDGKVRGFGARVLSDGIAGQNDGPKYINSRQSRVFDKSEILYGLQQARTEVKKEDRVILVEGYFDVLSLVAAGIKNVVATCGTALTEKHANILRRFCSKVVTIFDADSAGLSASYRSAEVLLRVGVSPYMVNLPAGEDPDSFVRKNQAEGFKKLVESAKPAIEVLADIGIRAAGNDVESRTSAMHKLIPLLAACKDDLRLGNYVRLLADRFGVDQASIMSAVKQPQKRGVTVENNAANNQTGNLPEIPVFDEETIWQNVPIEEETCLVLLLKYPRLAASLNESSVVEQFVSKSICSLVNRIIGDIEKMSLDKENSLVPVPYLSEIGNEPFRSQVAEKIMDDDQFPDDKAESVLHDCILKVKKRHIENQLRRVAEDMRRVGYADQSPEQSKATKNQLLRDKMKLSRELAALDVAAGKM
jgi:DNA primase